MNGWWISNLYQNGQIVALISWIFWVIFSITMHELAHGWTATWQGDPTPRRLGRLTMNPYVHMGPMSLLVFAVMGIAWGLMPIDPSKFRWGRWGRLVVAAAGPAMNIVLAVIAIMGAIAFVRFGDQGVRFQSNAIEFFFYGAWLNVLLALLNLLPIPPLDGSTILSSLSLRIYMLYQHPNAQIFGFAFLMILVLTRMTSFIFSWVWWMIVWIIETAGGDQMAFIS